MSVCTSAGYAHITFLVGVGEERRVDLQTRLEKGNLSLIHKIDLPSQLTLTSLFFLTDISSTYCYTMLWTLSPSMGEHYLSIPSFSFKKENWLWTSTSSK